MFEKIKAVLDQRKTLRSREKVAQMVVASAKEKTGFVLKDTEMCVAAFACIAEVSVSYGYADGLVWPSRDGVAVPLEAINECWRIGKGDPATLLTYVTR